MPRGKVGATEYKARIEEVRASLALIGKQATRAKVMAAWGIKQETWETYAKLAYGLLRRDTESAIEEDRAVYVARLERAIAGSSGRNRLSFMRELAKVQGTYRPVKIEASFGKLPFDDAALEREVGLPEATPNDPPQ